MVSFTQIPKARLWLTLQAHSFIVEADSRSFKPYQRGGLVTQVKESKTLSFKTLAQSSTDPGEFLLSDFSKLERPALLHLAFQALDAYQVCHLLCPPAHCSQEARLHTLFPFNCAPSALYPVDSRNPMPLLGKRASILYSKCNTATRD